MDIQNTPDTKDTAQDTPAQTDPQIVAKARELGWVPQEEFQGDPERWVDAPTFVKRGQEIMPILRQNNKRLEAQIGSITQQLSSTQAALEEAREAIDEFHKYHEEDSKRQYERALETLKAQRRAAIKAQDVEAQLEIEDAIEELRERKDATPPAKTSKKEPVPQPDPTQNPDFQEWYSANQQWFGKNKSMTTYAMSIAAFLRQTEPDLVGRDFYRKVSQEVEMRFNTSPKGKVEGGGEPTQPKTKHTYRDLPPADKESCDRFAKRLVGPNRAFKTEQAWRDHFVSHYFGE